jgi:hypothetical protein
MKPRTLAWMLVACLAVTSGWPEPAAAAPSRAGVKTRAEQLAEQAEEALQAKRFEEAIGLLRRARDLEPGPRWTVALAEAMAASGKLLQGRQLLHEAKSRARLPQPVLETALAKMDARIPTLLVNVSGPTRGVAVISIDGKPREDSAYGPVQLDPGTYVVRASAPGYHAVEEKIVIEASSPREVTLKLEVDGPREPEYYELSPVQDSTWKRSVAVGSFALAGAGIVVGTVSWFKRNGKVAKADDLFLRCDPGMCSASERAEIDSLDDESVRAATVTGVSLGVAALATGLGLYLWTDARSVSIDSEASVAWEPGLGSMTVRGRF